MLLPFDALRCHKPLSLLCQPQEKPYTWLLHCAMSVSKHIHTPAPQPCSPLASHCCSVPVNEISVFCFLLLFPFLGLLHHCRLCECLLLSPGKTHPSWSRPITYRAWVGQAALVRAARAVVPAGGVKGGARDHNLFYQHLVLRCDSLCVWRSSPVV